MDKLRLTRSQLIPRSRQEVFQFFSRPENLERITPDFLNFHIVSDRPVPMHEGAFIDYSLRLFGLPVRWQARIKGYEPDVRFADVQYRGPYRSWHHVHEFEDAPGGTLMIDTVDYQMPLGALGALAHTVTIRRTLDRIFDYRQQAVSEIFS